MAFQIIVDPHPAQGLLLPFVRLILDVYRRRGLEPDIVLAQAGIDRKILRSRQVPVSMEQLMALAHRSMRELDDEGLGWFSRPIPWGSFGMLAWGSLTAPTVGVALMRWMRHLNILVPDIHAGLSTDQGWAALLLREKRQTWGSPLCRELALATTLRCSLGLACWIADSSIPIADVRFPFKAPLHPANALLFDGQARSGEGPACLWFDSRYLDLPNRRNETDLRAMLRDEAIRLTTFRYQRDRLLVSRVRALLSEATGSTVSTAEIIADTLHISPRTLHRQLKEEGTTLQLMKNEVRRTKAIHLLSHTTRSIKHIAREVGFSYEQGFNRAFRQWTGESPRRFRASQSVRAG